MNERIPQVPVAAQSNPFRPDRTSSLPPTKSERTSSMRVPPKNLREAILELTPNDKKIRFLAKGGEQLVLEYAGRSSVYKVNFKKTAQAGYDTGFSKEWMREELRKEKQQQDQDLRLVREYFGYEAVPAFQSRVEDVPLSDEVMDFLGAGFLKEMLPEQTRSEHENVSLDAARGRTKNLPALVMIQRKVDLSDAVSLTGYYPEVSTSEFRKNAEELSEEEWMRNYEIGHELLVSPANSGESYGDDVERALEMYPDLGDVAHLAHEDRGFRLRLKETVKTAIRFMSETGKVLDLAGRRNVCIKPESDGWRLLMPDALHGDNSTLAALHDIQEKIQRHEELRRDDVFEALNVINSVRVVNALAILAGIKDRLVIPGLNRIPGDVWLRELQPVLD